MGGTPSWRVGIDVGGTFTDLCLVDATGRRIILAKVLTTPRDLARGVISGLERALAAGGVPASMVTHIIHGTTVATNAIIERKGARTALITTRGFRDVLEIGREFRYDTDDPYIVFPEPLVPRWLRREVTERVTASGEVLAEPDSGEIAALARELLDVGVESVAIAFLHAYADHRHERAAAVRFAEIAPAVSVSTSAEVARQEREFERTSTCVLNAYVKPLVNRYLGRLESGLSNVGAGGRLMIMMSSGGMADVSTARAFPVRMVESGPAAGALGARAVSRLLGEPDVLAFDMGGTTAKACLIEEGAVAVTNQFEVARVHRFRQGSGYPILTSAIDLIEIGAGGGSIAYVGDLGLLKVGPESAGADPGPACYSLGGTRPTVTDADLLLGYLNPSYFLGGELRLDRERALAAVRDVCAAPLGLPPMEVAMGIYDVINEHMASVVRTYVAERGRDSRRFTMVAFGGAGPVHAYEVARRLEISRVVCPPGAGVFSALGLLAAPAAFDYAATYATRVDKIDWTRVKALYEEMERHAAPVMQAAGIPRDSVTYARSVDMRFLGQGYEVTVPLADLQGNGAVHILLSRFETIYKDTYGWSVPGVPVEAVNWRLRVQGPEPVLHLDLEAPLAGENLEASLKDEREMYVPETRTFARVPVYNRYTLPADVPLPGPAIIEEREATVMVGPRAVARKTLQGFLIMDLT